MEENLEKGLVSRYPMLYRHYRGDPKDTCMAWGFSCGDGWYLILEDLSQKITEIDRKNLVVVDQVKEKFGGLRFYYHIDRESETRFLWYWNFRGWLNQKVFSKIPHYYKIRNYLIDLRQKYIYKKLHEKVSEFVREAEMRAYKTCEACGNPGTTRGGGWVKTLCDSCDKKN